MPWNKNDFPDSLKNLNDEVRDKTIEIANALLKDGMEEGRAIAIATDKAREYVGGTSEQDVYYVNSHANGWQLTKKTGDRAIYVEKTKQDLLDKAKSYVNDHNGVLKVFHEDGSLQDTLYEND